jgi:hypothetical protein
MVIFVLMACTKGAGVDDSGALDTSEGVDPCTRYIDADGDTWGDPGSAFVNCDDIVGSVTRGGDCDDADPDANPDGVEVCDDRDQDCDDAVDEDATDAIPSWLDDDGDDFGAPGTAQAVCELGDRAPTGGDCLDTDPTVFPGSHAIEVPFDGVDTDCDGIDACTDLNCDGWTDVVLGTYFDSGGAFESNSFVFLGSEAGPGDRTLLPTVGNHELLAHDLDADGYQDLVFTSWQNGANSYDGDTWIYWGSASGHGVADRTALSGRGGRGSCVGDFDGDGWPDLAVANYFSTTQGYDQFSWVFYGRTARFDDSDKDALYTQGARGCTAADLDADGYDDVVWWEFFGNDDQYQLADQHIYWGGPDGVSGDDVTPLGVGGGVGDALARDLNGDGHLDLAFAVLRNNENFGTNSVVYWGSAAGFDESARTELETTGAFRIASADFDQDGHLDLAFSSYATLVGASGGNRGALFYGSASGYAPSDRATFACDTGYGMAVGDVNDDGYPDLAVANFYDGGTTATDSAIYYGSAAGLTGPDALGTVGALDVGLADLDEDGWGDAVFGSYTTATNDPATPGYAYFGSAGGYSVTQRTPLSVYANTHVLLVGRSVY